jgi:hypothetical protein
MKEFKEIIDISKNNNLNVIIDISGSIDNQFDNVLKYLFDNGLILTIIQVDHKVRSAKTFNSFNNYLKFKKNGKGGTVIQSAINYIEKLNPLNLCILTDGLTDKLDFSNLNNCEKVIIVSIDQICPILNSGNVLIKQIIINIDENLKLPGGFIDWNKLSLDQMVNYLKKKYMFDSSGDAKCIFELIDFYEKHKTI